ncbi:hypothetical protein PS907_03122 [Pseudomonas fluorescens]|uniref:Uncharacterized protein n=1 Tax=Pseudomonas fluorescens TaxID=294 RepID=A0A5E7RUJ5_PSEFL|nr:hypothetical protein PS683_02377 [Pseudomonas fluorescens]VVM82513.1 hypothetical protein PS683_02377 [Pseudomonas fluorescens]VVP77198.1 hypothetical protein PS907_03122 [Pseudomonas fluorescens]
MITVLRVKKKTHYRERGGSRHRKVLGPRNDIS